MDSFKKKSGKFQARIWWGGQHRYIGLFDTPEQASAAYLSVKKDLAGANLSAVGADEADDVFNEVRKKALDSFGGVVRKKRDLPEGVIKASSGKFRSNIRWGGKQRTIGTFGTPEQASAAYLSVKKDLAGAKPSAFSADEVEAMFDEAKKKALEALGIFVPGKRDLPQGVYRITREVSIHMANPHPRQKRSLSSNSAPPSGENTVTPTCSALTRIASQANSDLDTEAEVDILCGVEKEVAKTFDNYVKTIDCTTRTIGPFHSYLCRLGKIVTKKNLSARWTVDTVLTGKYQKTQFTRPDCEGPKLSSVEFMKVLYDEVKKRNLQDEDFPKEHSVLNEALELLDNKARKIGEDKYDLEIPKNLNDLKTQGAETERALRLAKRSKTEARS